MPYIRSLGKKNAQGKRVGPPYQCVYRDASGKRHSRPGFATKAAARSWGEEQEAKVRVGRHVAPKHGKTRFEDWHKRWWANRVVEPTTLAKNKSHLDKHVLPQWENWPLGAITHEDVQGWVKQMQQDGVGADTIRACVALMSAMLRSAVRSRLIGHNPCEELDIPTVVLRPARYMTRAEVDLMVTELRAPYDLLVLTAAYTGLRWGELAGLHGTRVDLLRRRLEVVETLTEVNGRFAVRRYPKTAKSRRVVPLTDRLTDALAAYITDRDQLIFRSPRSASPLSRNRFNERYWKPTIAKLNTQAGKDKRPPVIPTPLPRPHDLRHTYASWLVQAGVSLYVVQERLGHDDYKTTQRYSHLQPNANDDVLRALGDDPQGRLTSEL